MLNLMCRCPSLCWCGWTFGLPHQQITVLPGKGGWVRVRVRVRVRVKVLVTFCAMCGYSRSSTLSLSLALAHTSSMVYNLPWNVIRRSF